MISQEEFMNSAFGSDEGEPRSLLTFAFKKVSKKNGESILKNSFAVEKAVADMEIYSDKAELLLTFPSPDELELFCINNAISDYVSALQQYTEEEEYFPVFYLTLHPKKHKLKTYLEAHCPIGYSLICDDVRQYPTKILLEFSNDTLTLCENEDLDENAIEEEARAEIERDLFYKAEKEKRDAESEEFRRRRELLEKKLRLH